MIDQDIRNVLRIIHRRLDDNQIRWALVGSANTKLQGMGTEPRDIDIVTRYEDLQKVSGIFSDYSASNIMELEVLSDTTVWEVKVKIDGAEVQFISGEEKDVYVSKLLADKIIYIRLDDLEIPCFTLEAEAQAYMETGREHKAYLIQQYLGRGN